MIKEQIKIAIEIESLNIQGWNAIAKYVYRAGFKMAKELDTEIIKSH